MLPTLPFEVLKVDYCSWFYHAPEQYSNCQTHYAQFPFLDNVPDFFIDKRSYIFHEC